MAQVDSSNNPNDPTNPNNPQNPNAAQGNQNTNQPATTGGAGAVTSTGSGNVTGQVVGTANPSQPFQNIASYLAANQPGSKTLAGQVADTVSNPINEANANIGKAGSAFTESVNKGYTPENNDLISAVSNNPAYVVAENPDNVANFKGQLNNKYTGPTDFTQFEGYGDLQTQIANAQQQANNTNSESGIQSLLKSVEGPTTAGINKFDSLLLSADPSNYKTIQDAGAGAANLVPTLANTTTAQNAVAAQGSTNAAKTVSDALAALDTARGAESTNLTAQQKSIEDIVNQYNKSVSAINPATASIAQAIQDFLSKNPNLTMGGGADALAPWENLQNINMPDISTYAGPQDYAQIAALMQLGDTNVGGLPINSSTADQAQTFNLPKQLQDALGKAPEVEKALQDELSGFGNQITSAEAPFIAAQQQSDKGRQDFQAITGTNNINIGLDPVNFPTLQGVPAMINGKVNPAWQQIAQKAMAAKQYAEAGDKAQGDAAKNLQWVNGTSGSLQDLIASINDQLSSLGNVGVPNFTYAPNAPQSVTAGAPIGKQIASDVGTSVAEAVPASVGAGIGAGISAAQAAGIVPMTASSLAAAAPGTVAGQVPTISGELAAAGQAGGLTALQTLGPAALAAYGASNIEKNAAANPIKSGIATLANTGLSLATLSLPPNILNSIGKEITNVFHDIGSFFGHLF